MKKIGLLILLILFMAGCFGNDEEKQDQNTNGDKWAGPTDGPWEEWTRLNDGDQFLKYNFAITALETTGWVTIEINALEDDTYQFEIEVLAENLLDGEDYTDTNSFVLDKRGNFYVATYDSPIKGRMNETIFEILSPLDSPSLWTHITLGDSPSITWEENFESTFPNPFGSETTINIGEKTTIAGITGLHVELIKHHSEDSETTYIINPDIKFPLYLSEKHSGEENIDFEFELIEYEIRN